LLSHSVVVQPWDGSHRKHLVFQQPLRRTAQKTAFQRANLLCALTWLPSRNAPSHCPTTGVLAEPFFSNGCLCYLHSRAFSRHATICWLRQESERG
jgi:hypothetical protein